MRGRNFWAVYERGASLLLVGIVTLLGVSLSPAVPGARAAPTVTVWPPWNGAAGATL